MTGQRSAWLLIAPLLLVLLLSFVVPLVLLLPTSFQEYQPGQGMVAGSFTWENYLRIATDGYYREVVLRTLALGLGVTVLCLLTGYPVAYLIVRGHPRWRLPLTLLVIFPLMLNLVVRSFGWIVLLTNRGVVNNLLIDLGLIERPLKLMFNMTGLLIGLTHIYLPFMVLMLVAALQNVPRDVEAAAATLGSSRTHVFWSVTLPLTAPGIIGGSILVFVLTISALVTPRMLGGPTYQVMATLIYDEYMQLLDWPSGSALSFALAASTLVIIWLSSRMTKRWAGMA
ncbi:MULTISPECIES: ABC transporter permease [Paracoccus]|uniref:ABC transporter permease n=1 Tax=Paracoccus TaxID=265 RepID=UPI000DF83506|nr:MULTISPECIES: ABC transporter permease [Paracoccus]MCJ1902949.1 ABC transporter permease [Paracoccus versutus]MDF3904268.1 ABC transporter permease [Paracoccus sp. AS002]RDD70922.1 ABC transporter permease [Paracoccus versutus]